METTDLTASGISYETVKKAHQNNVRKWAFVKNDLNRILVDYEKMPHKYRELVDKKFIDPYKYQAQQPIRDLIAPDFAAHKFYTDYRYGDNNECKLSGELIDKYTKAACYMNMIVKCKADNLFIKRELGIPLIKFIETVCDIIKQDGISLPKCYRRLNEKIDAYKGEDGPNYDCLISGNVGVANNGKITDELSVELLGKLISKPHIDDVTITRGYNNWARVNDRKEIGVGTVGNFKRERDAFLRNEKHGAKKWFDKYGKVTKRRRASCANACWEHDDNDLDLYYIKNKKNKKGKVQVFYYGRFVIAVVMDTFNDYILGWAIAEVYTKELIKFAYLDAFYHINELTGGWYLPHQIRSDRFGLDAKLTNDLAQFYEKIATFTPAKAKSARGKYIEQSFGKKWHQVLCQYPNYAGHNIQSKTGINQELIETNKRVFPNELEAPFEIADFVDKMRHLQKVENGPSRQEVWLESFHASEIAKENKIDYEQLLTLCGTMHTFHNQIGDNKVQITSRCIEVTINKKFYEYDVPDEIYMDVVGKRVNIIYDPLNPAQVLATDGNNVRFMAPRLTEDMKMPSAIIDFKQGDRARLNDMIRAKTEHVKMFTKAKEKRDNLIELNRIDTEGVLQSGLLIKHQKQHAELAYQNYLLGTGTGNAIEDALNKM